MAENTLLEVEVDHYQGALHLKMRFELTNDWTILFGPSGSGKSTVLRLVAGLTKPRLGRIVYGGSVLTDTSGKTLIPPYKRPVRGAAQIAWLMPRMTVRECLRSAIPGRFPGEPEGRFLNEILEIFHIKSLINTDSTALSGGERQRVSVASAVLAAATFEGPEKPLLLLDEPFSGLGRELRDTIAMGLRKRLRSWKIPVLSVSHDVAECFLLNAEVIRIADGKLLAQGPVDEVLADERKRILAELKG